MNQLFGRNPDEPVNIGYTWTGRMLDCLKNKPLNDGPDIEIAEAFFLGSPIGTFMHEKCWPK